MPTKGNKLAPQISPIESNPVGWSSIYAPEWATNLSPDFSPLASSALMTPEQKLGRFWNVVNRLAKPGYTNADLPQLTKAGNEGMDAALGWTGSTTPIRAYHGSPHTFDRFDLSKIGTGEGAQAYGHGLYFAGNEGVAGSYRSLLSRVPLVNGKQVTGLEGAAEAYLVNAGGDAAAALKAAQEEASALSQSSRKVDRFRAIGAQKAAATLEEWHAANAVTKPGGSMYEVNLRTSPERLLDWDKPLAQQSGPVRKSLNEIRDVYGSGGKPFATDEHPASMFHQLLSRPEYSGSQARAATDLKAVGLDGIQYLDGGSRAAGDGSRNYVMFNDQLIDILRRYGLLGMVGGGAAAGNKLAPQEQQ